MAVHPEHPGLTVEIVVDKKPLPEFDDEAGEDDPTTVTRYIEAQPAAEFAIRYTFAKDFKTKQDVSVKIYVDGSNVANPLHRNRELSSKNGHQVPGVRSKEPSGWVMRNFRFKELVESRESLAQIGTIRIDFSFGKMKPPRKSSEYKGFEVREKDSISEKAMKGEAKSLQTSFGSKRATIGLDKFKFNRKHTFATFIFKYRTQANLQAFWIIPHSPSPQAPRLRLPKERDTHEPASKSQHRNATTTNTQPQGAANIILTPSQQGSVQPTSNEHDGIRDQDIVALIKHYRGDDNGLAGQSRKRLLVLLKHYEEQDTESVPTEQEPNHGEPQVRVKREHTDDDAARG